MDTPGLKSIIAKVKMPLAGLRSRSEQGTVKTDQNMQSAKRDVQEKLTESKRAMGDHQFTPANMGREYQEKREKHQEKL